MKRAVVHAVAVAIVAALGAVTPACGEPAPKVVVATPVASATSAPSASSTAPPAPASAATPGPGSGTSPAFPPSSGGVTLRADAFGGTRFGFAEASSKNGRFVFLRRFQGSARPTFGQHGESRTPTDLALFDRVDGSERAVEDVVDVDAGRRFFLVVEAGALRVLDAESGASVSLDAADMSGDGNACLPPRQGAFSASGARVGWVTSGGFAVRDLASGATWTVKPAARLWRGWPDDTGRGATLAEVSAAGADWPHQNTSCACRWCGRFAMSYGMYGWSGPAFAIEHVDDAGARQKADPPKGGPRHGPTAAGCKLVARAGDALEEGPWRWDCAKPKP